MKTWTVPDSKGRGVRTERRRRRHQRGQERDAADADDVADADGNADDKRRGISRPGVDHLQRPRREVEDFEGKSGSNRFLTSFRQTLPTGRWL